MLNSHQFAIITVEEAKAVLDGFHKLLNPESKHGHWRGPDFNKRMQEAGLMHLYYSLESLVQDNDRWEQLKLG